MLPSKSLALPFSITSRVSQRTSPTTSPTTSTSRFSSTTSHPSLYKTRILDLLRPGLIPSTPSSPYPRLDPSNPIYNFLISYYGFSGSKGVGRLCRYSPGPDVPFNTGELDGMNVPYTRRYLTSSSSHSELSYYDSSQMKNRSGLSWNLNLLKCTRSNTPVLNCYGLHEWAMLYRPASDDVGSSYQGGLPLRVDLSVVEEVVDKGGLKCTHIDAIR